MQKLRIIQFILRLPREKQIPAILLLFIFASLGSNTAIVLYFRNELRIEREGRDSDNKYHRQLERAKDSIHEASQNKNIDFMKEIFMDGTKQQRQIDSLKLIQKMKK